MQRLFLLPREMIFNESKARERERLKERCLYIYDIGRDESDPVELQLRQTDKQNGERK